MPTPATSPLVGVEVLLLDVNETLSDLRPLARRFADVGLPESGLDAWFAGVLRDGFALTLSAGAVAESPGAAPPAVEAPEMVRFVEIAAGNLAIALAAAGRQAESSPADVAHVLAGIAELELHPDVAPGLGRLAAAGRRLVPLTNGATAMSEPMFARAGVLGLFEHRLSVEDVGRWKPAPEPYRYALEVCQVSVEQAALVAVHPWDVQGAQRAGLRGVWVNRDGGSYPAYLPPPDLEVPDFHALADLLG